MEMFRRLAPVAAQGSLMRDALTDHGAPPGD